MGPSCLAWNQDYSHQLRSLSVGFLYHSDPPEVCSVPMDEGGCTKHGSFLPCMETEQFTPAEKSFSTVFFIIQTVQKHKPIWMTVCPRGLVDAGLYLK